jgi:hypothetical protein
MAFTIAVSHGIFAALLLTLGLALAGSILVFKPSIDRAALPELTDN